MGRACGAHLHSQAWRINPVDGLVAPPVFIALSFVCSPRTKIITSDTEISRLKAAFRQDAQASRRALVAGLDVGAAALALAGHVGAALEGRAPGIVTGFLAIGDEIDTEPALATLAERGWQRALPVVVGRGQALEFRAWAPGDALEDGPLRTRHPAAAAAVAPDVLLVPLLAFDKAGMRMGWGGGFYDRTLTGLRAANPEVVAIGVGFAGQAVDKVPSGPHDVALDAVATEAGVMWIGDDA